MTVHERDDAGAIVREIHIDASPAIVFPYFTDPDKLRVWKAVTAEADGRVGGSFRVDITGRRDIAFGTYLELDPPRRIVFTWRWLNSDAGPDQPASVVEVTLDPDGEGTLLRLVHRGVAPHQRAGSGEGWTHYLARLAVAAGGADPGPDPWADASARSAR
jgi:uncharacterized protein YndB with AHSA1/START domain